MRVRTLIGKVLRRWADRIDGGPPVVTLHLHAEYEPCTARCQTLLAGPKPWPSTASGLIRTRKPDRSVPDIT